MFTRARIGLAVLLSAIAGAATTAATAHADTGPLTVYCTIRCGTDVGGSGNLAAHGGPVESSSTNYLIFWGPFAEGEVGLNTNVCSTVPCSAADGPPLPDYALLIERFLNDVGGTSYYGMLGQYGAGNSSRLGGVYVDPNIRVNLSSSNLIGGVVGLVPPTLQDSDVQNEVRSAEISNGWTGGNGHNFIVVLPPGYTECHPTLGCSSNNFCGYHEDLSDHFGVETPYIVLPFPENPPTDPNLLAGCTIGVSPNGDPAADDAVNVLSHELFEAVTDPLLTAWWDGDGQEIGDKCVMTFGPTDDIGADVTLHGDPYIVQREYSNRISNCAMS